MLSTLPFTPLWTRMWCVSDWIHSTESHAWGYSLINSAFVSFSSHEKLYRIATAVKRYPFSTHCWLFSRQQATTPTFNGTNVPWMKMKEKLWWNQNVKMSVWIDVFVFPIMKIMHFLYAKSVFTSVWTCFIHTVIKLPASCCCFSIRYLSSAMTEFNNQKGTKLK